MKKIKVAKIYISKNLVVFLIFLLLSGILWFLNSLEKIYTTQITLEVEYYNFPPKKINIFNTTNKFNLNIKGKGFDILKFQMKKRLLPLTIDIAKIGLKAIKKDSANYFIPTKELIPQIEMQLPSNLTLEAITPDTVYFYLVKTITRKIKILPNVKVSLKPQYTQIRAPYLIPDTAIIQGPENIVDTLYFIYTAYQEFNNVDHSIKTELSVVSPEYTIVSPNKVKVVIEVEEYTEKILHIPIEIINIPDTAKLLIFPNTLTIKAKIGLSKYDSLKPEQFKAIVDFNQLNNSISDKLTVELFQQPSFIYDLEYKPHFVEYILESTKK